MALDDLDQLLAELDGIEDPRGPAPVPRHSIKSQLNLDELDRLVEDFEQVKRGEPKPQVVPTSPKPQAIVQPATPTKQTVKAAPKSEPAKFDSSNYSWRHDAKGSQPQKEATPAPAPSTTHVTPAPSKTQPSPVVHPTQTSAPTPSTPPITKSNSSSGSSAPPATTPTAPATLPASQPPGGSGQAPQDTTKKDFRHSKRVSVFALKPINTNDICASCGYNVKGEHVVALGKIFHTNHFTCAACGLQLSNDFFEHEGKPSCGPCMEKYFTCCKCGQGIEAEYFDVAGLKYHGSCLDRGTCARCGKGINSAETTALGKNYHPECFTCYGCGFKLEGTFYAKNNEPYCPRCASNRAPVAPGGLVACVVCKQQLTGSYVTFNSENYHSQCFTCAKCKQVLPVDSFYIIKQQFHCERCAKA